MAPGGRKLLVGVVTLLLLQPAVADAHTQPDFVAIPAGDTATVNLRPMHGCGTSPTVSVAVRAPVEGATGGEVAGWALTTEPDGFGNTILTWSDGLLPADQPGAFPITFTVPDTVGELLLFPAVQTCQNGDELAWISGDPESDYPAPRILVLAPGSQPAATIDDVPSDAPGRDLLVAVVDVDNPHSTTTTTMVTESTTTTLVTTTTTTTDPGPGTTSVEVAPEPPTSGGAAPWPVVALAFLGAVATTGVVMILRRRRGSD